MVDLSAPAAGGVKGRKNIAFFGGAPGRRAPKNPRLEDGEEGTLLSTVCLL